MRAVDLFAGLGGFTTGARMRMVRAVEGRALMGFPADYQLPANEAQAWHLIGNAVAPVQACDVIDALRMAA